MTSRWDFRSILHVDPDEDRTCVGIAKSYGRRCKNPINVADRGTASLLLDQMDRCKDFLSSLDYIRKLSALMLCKSVHNNHKSRAHLSQVGEVEARWTVVIEQHHAALKKQQERTALRTLKREIESVKAEAVNLKAEFQEDEIKKEEPNITEEYASSAPLRRAVSKAPAPVLVPLFGLSSAKAVQVLGGVQMDDPFVRKSPTNRSNIFSKADYARAAQIMYERKGNASGLSHTSPSHSSSVSENNSSLKHTSISEQPSSTLPSPPESPELRRSKIREGKMPEYLAASTTFETEANQKRTRQLQPKSEQKSQSEPLSSQHIAPKKKEEDGKMFEFGHSYDTSPKPFSFNSIAGTKPATPIALEARDICTNIITTKAEFEATTETPSIQNKHPELYLANQKYPRKQIPPSQVPLISSPTQPTEDITEQADKAKSPTESTPSPPPKASPSFGYAVITPPSSHKVYLTAARQVYGLFTPPETPESALKKCSPGGDSGYFSSPSPLVFEKSKNEGQRKGLDRKPLPIHRDAVAGEKIKNVNADASRGNEDSTASDMSNSVNKGLVGGNVQEDELVGVKVGCLSRLGLRRLGEKLVVKVKGMRRSRDD